MGRLFLWTLHGALQAYINPLWLQFLKLICCHQNHGADCVSINGNYIVWGIEVHKLSGKPHLRNRGNIVAAQLMPIDRTFKEQWLYFTDYFILPLQQAIPIYSVIQLSIFFLVLSLSHFLPVSFLNCLCPWKSFSNLSTSTLYQHALLSDDILISYNSSHLSWNPTPAPMFNKFNGTLWLPLKPFLAPCPNTLNTNFQTWIYFGDLIGFSFSLPPGTSISNHDKHRCNFCSYNSHPHTPNSTVSPEAPY